MPCLTCALWTVCLMCCCCLSLQYDKKWEGEPVPFPSAADCEDETNVHCTFSNGPQFKGRDANEWREWIRKRVVKLPAPDSKEFPEKDYPDQHTNRYTEEYSGVLLDVEAYGGGGSIPIEVFKHLHIKCCVSAHRQGIGLQFVTNCYNL